jgi:hypothetical protein
MFMALAHVRGGVAALFWWLVALMAGVVTGLLGLFRAMRWI